MTPLLSSPFFPLVLLHASPPFIFPVTPTLPCVALSLLVLADVVEVGEEAEEEDDDAHEDDDDVIDDDDEHVEMTPCW